jgi:hypothetical protein
MNYSQSRRAVLLGLVVAVSLVGGCNRRKTVTVKGSVVRNGQPLAVGPTGYVQVTLRPDVAPGEQYTDNIGRCEKDGSFTILEVPPGKFRVGIQQFDPTPQTDKLNWAYAPESSKIVRDIDGKEPLLIDLAKPGP